MNKHIDFCIACRKQTEYELRMNNVRKRIRGKEHEFSVISAICKTCGSEMGFPWLIDLNIKRIDDQYRLQEGLVSVEDIRYRRNQEQDRQESGKADCDSHLFDRGLFAHITQNAERCHGAGKDIYCGQERYARDAVDRFVQVG